MIKLSAGRMKEAEYERRNWWVTTGSGVDYEDVLAPEFWGHVAKKMQSYDEITIRSDDGAWWAKLLVLNVGNQWVKVQEIHKLDLMDDETDSDYGDGLSVMYKGRVKMWCVLRGTDLVHEGSKTKDDAAVWLAEHRRMMAA